MDEAGSEVTTRDLRSATDRIRELHPAARDVAGAQVKLDVRQADERKFVETRLRFVGKNRANSPNLFARLDASSKAGKLEPISQAPDPLTCENPLSVLPVPGQTDQWEARIITNCFSGADYSYVDLFWWDTVTGEILAYDFSENFENPKDLSLVITGNAADIGTRIQVDSMAINTRGVEDYYGYADIIQDRPPSLVGTDLRFQPADINSDGAVVVCLDRQGGDCDYYYPGTSQIQLPISMNFRFPGTVSLISSVTAQIHMMNTGGVCSTINLTSYATIAAGGVQINTNGLPVSFGNKCVATQARVRFWIKIVAKTTSGKWYNMYWANDRTNDSKTFGLEFRWSCLAEGSKIVMADGTEKPIEMVAVGERVSSGPRGEWLSVVDITRGF
jgi:hypothetical protein